ncbi:MAG: PqqD family protein [Nevskiaceae bacterium]|jgi:hypothetical protein|nr:MAG: PqqD family protein [Nevskiaceae bacterium]TAM24849.1 MAG: PqqD family protein [Nevskiaceae bacterium]
MVKPPRPGLTAATEPYSQMPAGELMVRRSSQPSAPVGTEAERAAAKAALASARWKLHVGSARIVWSRLSEGELLESGGDAEALSQMVQARYGHDAEAAMRQVQRFLSQYRL